MYTVFNTYTVLRDDHVAQFMTYLHTKFHVPVSNPTLFNALNIDYERLPCSIICRAQHGAIPPLPQYAFMVWCLVENTGTTLPFALWGLLGFRAFLDLILKQKNPFEVALLIISLIGLSVWIYAKSLA